MRRNRNIPAYPADPADPADPTDPTDPTDLAAPDASATTSGNPSRPVLTNLRLCGSLEPCGKVKHSHNRSPKLVFSDPAACPATATMVSQFGFNEFAAEGNPVERTVLVNLAPYLTTASHHSCHHNPARHPSNPNPLFAEISAVIDTMQSSIDSLKDDVDSFKFPTEGSFSGPTRPAA